MQNVEARRNCYVSIQQILSAVMPDITQCQRYVIDALSRLIYGTPRYRFPDSSVFI